MIDAATTAPAAPIGRGTLAFAAVLALVVALDAGGAALGGSGATVAACLAILVVGMPHGTLDLELIRGGGTGWARRPGRVLALYLACAGAMYALWLLVPVAALLAFLAVATLHFSEDWEEVGSPFLALGVALAVLSAPAFAHRAALREIFVALTGEAGAAFVAEALLLVAPVAMGVALVAAFALARAGRADAAAGALCAVAATLLLPPAVGFALFFCLYHSPRHFAGALSDLRWRRFAQWGPVVVPLTLAALGIAAGLYWLGPLGVGAPMRLVAATFIALSVLTVPHMAVPPLLALIGRRAAGRSER